MITVHVSCSFCMPPRRPDVDIDIPSPNDFTVEYLTVPEPAQHLRFWIARDCHVDIVLTGPVTQEAVDMLIRVCQLQRDTFPSAGEEPTEDPEETKLQLCIAEGALKDIRKDIEAILPDSESGTATEAVQRLIREYEKCRER